MTLILSVASYRNRPPASPLVAQFEGPSIAIGRGADNDWSLPDPEIHLSKKHCVINFLDGQYTITDISTNGVFVNGSPEPLGNGGTALLRTGDRLLIGDYEIAVEIRANAQPGEGAPLYRGQAQRSDADPFGLDDIVNPTPVRPSPFASGPGEFPPAQDQVAGALGSDWLREYDPVPRAEQEPSQPQFGAHSDHVPSVNAAYRPPNVSFDPPPVGFDIPDNWQNAPDAVQAKPLSPPPADWQPGPFTQNAPPLDWQNTPMPNPAPPRAPTGWQAAPVAPNVNPAPPLPPERARGEAGPTRDTPQAFGDSQPFRETSRPPLDTFAPPRAPAAARAPSQPHRDAPPTPRREAHAPPPPTREPVSRPRDASPPPPRRETAAPAPHDIPSPAPEPSWQRREAPAAQEQLPPAREPTPPPRQQPTPIPAAAPSPPGRGYAADVGWRAFLEGAGLDQAAFSEDPVDLMRSLGHVFREMVGGLRDLLAIRDKVKTEYRVLRTVIQASNNNPLKFAIDGVEAANLLLSRPKPGHLVGPKAVNQAFNDLKAHEMAFMVGMQAAVTALLQEFDPVSLRKRIDAEMGWGDSIIPGARQSKYWSGYEEHYRKIANEISENARSTFGLAFAKAYEEQSNKL